MVVVHAPREDPALDVQPPAESRKPPIEVAVVENGNPADKVAAETPAINQADVRIDPLLLRVPRPKYRAGLQKQRLVRSPRSRVRPQRKHRVKRTPDVLAPGPADARVNPEAFLEQCEAALAQRVLDGIDQHARARVAKGAPAAFGIVARRSRRDGPAADIFKTAGTVKTVPDGEGLVAFGAAENAAPEALELLGRAHEEGLVRLRGRGQTGNRQQQEHSRRQQQRPRGTDTLSSNRFEI